MHRQNEPILMLREEVIADMKIASSTTLFGIVLAVSMFGAGIVADRLTNVYITNFPLDEQGNLKTAASTRSKTMLVFNQSVTYPSSTSEFYYITSFNTSGFRYFLVMAKGARSAFQFNSHIGICCYENNFGIRTFQGGGFELDLLTGELNDPRYGTGVLGASGVRIEAYAPSVDLYLRVYNSDIGFNGLLTIAVYLTD